MQTFDWYYRRLRVMSPKEIIWRINSSVRDLTDRFFVDRRQRTRKLSELLHGDGREEGPGFRVSALPIVFDKNKKDEKEEIEWYKSLLARAERIADHRLDLFDLKNKHLGDPIIWNRDHERGQDTPMVFSAALDYRDVREAGDCKFVWEPNRHHQLVVLGRAYRASGDIKFANAVAEQIDGWLRQNPFGLGMNWRSGLELGIRLINWVWALDLIKESGAIDEKLKHRILDSVARHVWEIDRKCSRGSSVNNHLVGEAAGVFVAASYLKNFKNASKWRAKSREILCREILNQTFPDGGNVEQAIGYHFFVLQFFVIAGITARAAGQDMPEPYWSRLEKMFGVLGYLTEGGDNLPLFGDCDYGYVLDLGDDPHDIRQWLAVGAALYDRSDFKTWAGSYAEPVKWLLGEPGRQGFKAIPKSQNKTITSRAFKDSGYYLLQHGEVDSPDRISVVFDCGPLGMEPLAGHGHADALSFTLRAFGKDILVDPGTYDYFSYPKWRKYFRSTAAHNTIVIDKQDQSEMLGLFLWGRRARARCLVWEPTDVGGKIVGEHDGYNHLEDPVTHRRTLELDGRNRKLIVHDEIRTGGKHEIETFFHFAEHCIVDRIGNNRCLIDVGLGTIMIELDPVLDVELFKGSDNPICGWVSRVYHHKESATTLVGSCTCDGKISIVCTFDIGESKQVD